MLEVEEAGKKVPYYLKDQTDYKKRMGEFGSLISSQFDPS